MATLPSGNFGVIFACAGSNYLGSKSEVGTLAYRMANAPFNPQTHDKRLVKMDEWKQSLHKKLDSLTER